MRISSLKTILACVLSVLAALPAIAQINLAGVYEGEMKESGERKRMYLTVDFINGTKDFTQVFTGKESQFKILPKDFMNAKKLKKSFAGTVAPGFARYNSKMLFSDTEEVKITNPRFEDGVLTADWVNTDGAKGICYFKVLPDRSLQVLGLTSLGRLISPDPMVLTLTEDLLPAGAEPYVTPADKYDLIAYLYDRNILNPPSVDSGNGIPKVSVAMDPEKTRRCGNTLVFYPIWRNGNAGSVGIVTNTNPFERNQNATIDDAPEYAVYKDNSSFDVVSGNEAVSEPVYVPGVPLDARKVNLLKIEGRAPDSPKCNEKNPYGEFSYQFRNYPVPEIPASNVPGCLIADSELALEILGIAKEGKNLVITFTVTNTGRRDKEFTLSDFGNGVARTSDGEQLASKMVMSDAIPAGEKAKGTITVAGGAGESFSSIRHGLNVRERGLNYDTRLILQKISAE